MKVLTANLRFCVAVVSVIVIIAAPITFVILRLQIRCDFDGKNSEKIRVGLLIMATGKYVNFTERLVTSARRYLLVNHAIYNTTYFIFTDYEADAAQGPDVVHVHQPKLGWPSDTLWRCEVYVNASFLLRQNVDYVLSIDADMQFVGLVGSEILGDLVGTLHPGFWRQSRSQFTYETRPESCASIPSASGWRYFAGGVYGGRTGKVLELCQKTTECVRQDLKNDIVAVWHDESQLNRYFLDNPPAVILSPAYCFPQGWHLSFTPKIIALKKPRHKRRPEP